MPRWTSPPSPALRAVIPRWLLNAALFWLLSGLGFTLAIHGLLSLQAERQVNLLRTQDATVIEGASRLLQHHLQGIHTDLRILTQTPIIQQLAKHPHDPALRAEAGHFMRTVVDEAQIYDQLRFIDQQGMEQVRVDLRNVGAVLIPAPELQDKSGRYFFQEAMRLPPGGIYLSPLDLNIEHGQIEVPHKPMIRLATPLFNATGQRLGIVIVNVYGDWLIQQFRQLMPPHREAVWLNAQGDWLTGPDPQRAWGFMFGQPGDFAQTQPELWAQMRSHPQGQRLQADGLWTYATLRPLQLPPRRRLQATTSAPPVSTPDRDYAWILASRIAPDHLPSSRIADNPLATGIHRAGLAVLFGFSVLLASVLDSRKRFRQQASDQAERLGNITAMMAEGLMVMDTQGKVTFVNPEAQRLLGWSADDLLGQDGHTRFHHHHADGHEAAHDACPIRAVATTRAVYRSENEVFFRRDGQAIPVGVSAAPLLRGDTLEGTVLVFSDLSRVKAYQAEIQQLAFHDALTGLPNRRLLKERLTQALGLAQRHQRQLALMYLDLDHFKAINDTLGHDGGDDLLQAVATRLTQSVRATDTVARMGGDEFVVLLPEVADRAAAAQVAQHILHTLKAPIHVKGQPLHVGVSIGVALFPDGARDANGLQQAADQAMYAAKQNGRHRYHVFTPETQQANPELTPN
ncbi:MAG: diguanylate cyclase [Aquabacterium sp.]|jgi:diguanylate cyclase (GGDEF)-like protein/PAS domain S-box-containing protein|uniref:diguanylate cyclase domain-containing protein n=1 Tax=Aquabacterium sp. TaxID=1872578 RepID=UPI002A36EFF2|nr:diguanylate cyclase [Aquabacterium sp.]MDX9844416.1 diguanylate cyclase [Aquabacterium sp.]